MIIVVEVAAVTGWNLGISFGHVFALGFLDQTIGKVSRLSSSLMRLRFRINFEVGLLLLWFRSFYDWLNLNRLVLVGRRWRFFTLWVLSASRLRRLHRNRH